MSKLVLIILCVVFYCSIVISGNISEDLSKNDYKETCNKPLFLTKYIKAGKIEEAQKLAQVKLLNNAGNFTSYSGYLTVNETCNSNLFFWFFQSKMNYKNAPVVLWLSGGPGFSSLHGLFEEFGPYSVNNGELFLKQYSWISVSSLLFIDSPVGAGYSFTKNYYCYATNQNDVRRDLYEALLQFFKLFPNFQKNDFFVFGESYGGKFAPSIAYSIHENNPKSEIKINLKGIGVANGLTDPVNMMVYSNFLYQIGLLDENGKHAVHKMEKKIIKLIKKEKWFEAKYSWDSVLYEIRNRTAQINVYNYAKMSESPETFMDYVIRSTTKCAIHVGYSEFSHVSMNVYDNLMVDFLKSVRPWVEILVENYKMLFYNGQYDIIVGYPLSRNFINNLNWSGANKFKKKNPVPFYSESGHKLCGFIKDYGNLYLAVVLNAGHYVARDNLECTFNIHKFFVS